MDKKCGAFFKNGISSFQDYCGGRGFSGNKKKKSQLLHSSFLVLKKDQAMRVTGFSAMHCIRQIYVKCKHFHILDEYARSLVN